EPTAGSRPAPCLPAAVRRSTANWSLVADKWTPTAPVALARRPATGVAPRADRALDQARVSPSRRRGYMRGLSASPIEPEGCRWAGLGFGSGDLLRRGGGSERR